MSSSFTLRHPNELVLICAAGAVTSQSLANGLGACRVRAPSFGEPLAVAD